MARQLATSGGCALQERLLRSSGIAQKPVTLSCACQLEAFVSSAKSSALTVYCNDKQYQATTRKASADNAPTSFTPEFPDSAPCFEARQGPRRQVGYRAQQKNRDKEHGAAATQPWVGRADGTSARESHSGSMMRRESAPFHHPQNRSSILSHHHAWHLPPTSQAQPDHRRCQALALRWVSYGQMCLIEAALAAQPGQTASRHHRPTSPGHRPISRGLASHHRRRCRQ